MLNVEIPFTLADEITVSNLKNLRNNCLEELSKFESRENPLSVSDKQDKAYVIKLLNAIAVVLDDLTVPE